MMKLALTALVAVAAIPSVSAATIQNPLAKDSVRLDLRELDLATVKGQRQLAIRMDQAAQAVCGDRVATIHLALDAQARSCRADVLADIRARIETRSGHLAAVAKPVEVALR